MKLTKSMHPLVSSNVNDNNKINSSEQIYQNMMNEFGVLLKKLPPRTFPYSQSKIPDQQALLAKLPSLTSIEELKTQLTDIASSETDHFNSFKCYTTRFKLISQNKAKILLEINGEEVPYSYVNLHDSNECDRKQLAIEKAQLEKNNDPSKMQFYIKKLAHHCAHLSVEEEEPKSLKVGSEKLAHRHHLFNVLYELFSLALKYNDICSAKGFATTFLHNHITLQHKLNQEFVKLSFHYFKILLEDLYFQKDFVINSEQILASADLITIAKSAYHYCKHEDTSNEWPEIMASLALFQAIYLHRYEINLNKKSELKPIKRIEIDADKKTFESNYYPKPSLAYTGKNINRYLLNNNTILSHLKQAFSHYRLFPNCTNHETIKSNLIFIIELFAITLKETLSAIYTSKELAYDERRSFYNGIKANIIILKEIFDFAKAQKIVCFLNSLNSLSLVDALFDRFINASNKEFETESAKAKIAEERLLKEEKAKSKITKQHNQPNRYKQEKKEKNTSNEQPRSSSSEKNENDSTEEQANVGHEYSYNEALLLLIKKEYLKALTVFEAIKNSTSRKNMDIKIKAITAMAECHIEMAKIKLEQKPLTHCYNKKQPVTIEIREEVITIINHIQHAFDYCAQAKHLSFKRPKAERPLFLGCIELVALSASTASENLRKEKNSYLEKMDALKAKLTKAGLYGPEANNTQPEHLTARGVEWCRNCEAVLSNITSLANNFKQKIENAYEDCNQISPLSEEKNEKTEELFSDLGKNLESMKTASEDIKELNELKELERVADLILKSGNPYAQNPYFLLNQKDHAPQAHKAPESPLNLT